MHRIQRGRAALTFTPVVQRCVFFFLIPFLLATVIVGSCSPAKRQGPILPLVVLSPGSITAPTKGTHVNSGETFPLGIADPVPEWYHCHPGFTSVDIYLLEDKPATTSVDSTQQFSNYLHYYGHYLVNNIPGEFALYASSKIAELSVRPSQEVVHLLSIVHHRLRAWVCQNLGKSITERKSILPLSKQSRIVR